MKIVVAPNAFKDSLNAAEAGQAIAKGLVRAVPDAEIVQTPVADGGDGLFDIVKAVYGGETVPVTVTGPLFKKVQAEFLYLPDSKTAVIEMARASGLALLTPEERNARATTSLGVGELALAALAKGAKKIIIGIGGSATTDGGIGFASALGAQFLDASGRKVRPIGEDLPKVAAINI